ncbi:Uncharacterized membrane protein HdeD, DUF308 family [Tessaracoccus bendigoensis DSM 12906]|uniref:Uncharacterized membrane protein HdeD, DUF308 family n=1 Tax=Tessaracoccus bendigoensis DSM 12906 TaxID=1123357 RepID=A0A1M6F8W7_9ACTN|nr:DUF308 domain-containing protein [Tessaracoccus bendigoensis]SHI94113.1 Uncharacterized membrane protein HdeD, DUF308 family [Tessaracoccus bendigoensis DSM 12906]
MLYFERHTWPWLLSQGMLAVVVGAAMIAVADASLVTLGLIVGAWVILDGIWMILEGASDRRGAASDRVLVAGAGAVTVALGLLIAGNPAATVEALAFLTAFWFVFAGLREVFLAVRLRKEVDGEWALMVTGAVAVAMGFAGMVWPGLLLGALVWVLGLAAIVYGACLAASALHIRRIASVPVG